MSGKTADMLSRREIFDVLASSGRCRIAVCAAGQPYIEPVRFEWKIDHERVWFLIYCRSDSPALKYMRSNAKVSLEFERTDGDYTEAVTARGRVSYFFGTREICPFGDDCEEIQILAGTLSGFRFGEAQ